MRIAEITATTLLVKSKLPDADYVVNPYTGCHFGCAYCYASFMGRFVNEPIENWGNYLYVKTNAVEVFDRELRQWPPERRCSSIFLSSVTDPYQGAEKRYRLTRGILEVLVREQYPGMVSILTKSPLVLRDVELLRSLPNLEVGMTVTTTDDKVSRWLEVRAPAASRRLRTLKELSLQGISTYAFVGPLLPHFRYQRELLEELFARIADAGVRSLYVEHMNLRRYIKERLWQVLRNETQEVQAVYREASSSAHRQFLDSIVAELIQKYGFTLRLGEVLYHNEGRRGEEGTAASE